MAEQESRLAEKQRLLREEQRLFAEQEAADLRMLAEQHVPPPPPPPVAVLPQPPTVRATPSSRSVGTRMSSVPALLASTGVSRASSTNTVSTPAPTIKRQDISTNITLITARTDHPSGHTTFVYSVDCMKYRHLKLTLDFRGSTNLMLDDGGGLYLETSMNPYERKDVAVLRTMAPSSQAGWSLKQKVSVVEQEPTLNRKINMSTGREVSGGISASRSGSKSTGHLPPPALQQPPITHPSRRASFNRVYSRQPDGSWASGSQAQAVAPTAAPSLNTTAQQSRATAEQVSARDKVMQRAKKSAFYRRASLDRGDGVATPALPPGVAVVGQVAAPNQSPRSVSRGSGGEKPLLGILTGCGLQQYYPLFLGEAMDDMGLLRSLASSKAEFRRCLKDLGIARMGHRETILKAILTE